MSVTDLRILFLIDDLGAGGAQRQVVSLSNSFFSLGYRITVLTYSANSFFRKILLESGIEVITVNEKSLISRIIKVRRFIRTGGYKSVISFLGPPNFLNVIAAFPYREWKVIVSERSANPALLKSVKSRIIRMSYLFSDTVVSNSHSNIKLLCKINPLLPSFKCKVIYNSIDLDKYKPLQQFKFRAEGVLTILVPASYRKLKNILRLIEAVNMLSNKEKEQLLIKWYGDKTPGLHRDEILSEAITLVEKYNLQSVIHLLPLNNEIIDIIQNADAVGLFSLFEGLPNAICEGMACGKPIIASSVSDIPLFIKDDENGFLCDPLSTNSIKSSLQRLLVCTSLKLKKMGQRNRIKAIKLFSKDEITNQYIELFN